MQVNSYNNYNKNQISFGSKRILPVIVKDMNNKPVKAWFSRLRLSDPMDVDKMKKAQNWIDFNIYCAFQDGKPIYAIEKDSPSSNSPGKLMCIATTKSIENSFYFDFIQSAPNCSSRSEEKRQFKGVGTALMYGLVRFAEKSKAKWFSLTSVAEANSFYQKMDMQKINGMWQFDEAGMHNFIKKQRGKEFKVILPKKPERIKPKSFIDRIKTVISFQNKP